MDDRLRRVAAQVRPGSRLADIGTDHAYLPIHLVSAGICPSAIASDLRIGPVESARRHVAAAGLSERVQVRLGDGLDPVAPDEVDDIVIAGMGGETIAAILGAAAWIRDERYRLILQPMTRPEELRRYLLTNGFSLLRESVARDGGHLYTVMTAAFTGAAPVTDEAAYYRGALGVDGREYLQKEIDRLKKKEHGCRLAEKTDEADRWRDLIERLEGSL
ncbi:MAG: class I SAM-dependent methyltransferase [Acutalibacteraceae bacterium]|jgi:tRNA (adenine22-N1)-methyltransferase